MEDRTLVQSCCASMTAVLRVNQVLRELDVSGSELGDSGMIQLCEGLQHPDCTLQKLELDGCHLTEACCTHLSTALQMSPSLKHLDLRCNSLGDSGVQQLCEGQRHPDCKLEKIQIKCCSFTDLSCAALASVLSAGASLRELNVGGNDMGDPGMRLLCEGLKHPDCRLQALWVRHCLLSASGCASLSSALCLNSSLTELVVSNNELGDSGMTLLCEGLKHPDCKIHKLWVSSCSLTSACCTDLASVLSTNRGLAELDLSFNDLGDSGVMQLCAGLKDTNCRLRSLDLTDCSLTGKCFGDMASVFKKNSFLKELYFAQNNLVDSFMEHLCEGLNDGNCKLQILWIDSCTLTDVCCGPLASMLIASPSLTELYLGNNPLGDSGVKRLCEGLKDPACRLRTLWMGSCSLTHCCCEDVASAIGTCPSLTDLDLSWNELGDSGVRLLCDGLKQPSCKLKKLSISNCSFKTGCCGDLTEVLGINQSLTELGLNGNELGDSGVKQLCAGLKHPECRIQTLFLDTCSLTVSSCADLSSVLGTSQSLTALYLNYNKLGDSGVTQLCEGLKHPDCVMHTLGIAHCSFTGPSCRDLAAAMRTNSSLTKLNLSENELDESGIRELCEALEHPGTSIHTLWMADSFCPD